jgi:hypothetical protein
MRTLIKTFEFLPIDSTNNRIACQDEKACTAFSDAVLARINSKIMPFNRVGAYQSHRRQIASPRNRLVLPNGNCLPSLQESPMQFNPRVDAIA